MYCFAAGFEGCEVKIAESLRSMWLMEGCRGQAVPVKNISGSAGSSGPSVYGGHYDQNRVSVNEDCRADRGLISVSYGDQIIVGSVMMQLLVIEGQNRGSGCANAR